MRIRPILLLAAALAASAREPLRVTVEQATYLSGPGHEPPPGRPPFEPRIQAQVRIQGLGPKAVPEFRIWRLPETAVAALRRGRAIRPGPGAQRVDGTTRLLSPGLYRLLAPVGSAWTPGECLVVEVFLGGRWAGRDRAPLLAVDLLQREPPEGRDPKP